MPITTSAKKAMNRSQKLEKRNKDFKIRMKMAMKKFIKSIERGEKVAVADLSNLYKRIDKCQKVGILKPRNAGRKKARMAKMFHKVQTK
ncbi:MAG: 30S ribosomal protein S20 [Candidatus Peribacteria bacterium]|jgi:ribosomal protein S20|nr:30S ribosomal protein S20 [Candidatus Peribacteria bacterium]